MSDNKDVQDKANNEVKQKTKMIGDSSPLTKLISDTDDKVIKALNQIKLETFSVDELIILLDLVTQELKARTVLKTGKVSQAEIDVSFPKVDTDGINQFIVLPAKTQKTPEEIAKSSWQIVLVSTRKEDKPLAIQIHDDVMMGRTFEELAVDLDLTGLGAETMGVSRRHAMLRPTEKQLFLIDLGSTNGSFCNGMRASLGKPLEVNHNDTITLGGLNFNLQIIKKPGEVEA